MKNKYPFIPDKRMYAAVMGACSMIRATGHFHRAVEYYADKYGVDESELESHIRERQGAGQKGKKGGKYKYYIVCKVTNTDARWERSRSNYEIIRALSKENAEKRFWVADWYETRRDDYGGSYAGIYNHEVIGEYETKAQAESRLKEMLAG